jgi:hypothetical protein
MKYIHLSHYLFLVYLPKPPNTPPLFSILLPKFLCYIRYDSSDQASLITGIKLSLPLRHQCLPLQRLVLCLIVPRSSLSFPEGHLAPLFPSSNISQKIYPNVNS